MAEKKTLTLADIRHIESGFSYWAGEEGDREIEWLHRAWKAIIKAELADYQTELERCRVVVRCITLLSIYADFRYLAIDDQLEPCLEEDAKEFEIKPFHLGVLLTEADWMEIEDETDEFEFFRKALTFPIDAQR